MRGDAVSRLDWNRDGRDWPLREFSRFVTAGGLRWHVQTLGAGPVALLLHGTGAASHSWRALAPQLASLYTVVIPDLPGHAFTDPLPLAQQSLPGMAQALGALMRTLDVQPMVAIGHSAGAALAIRASIDRRVEPQRIVSINGALLPFPGVAGVIFPPLARVLARNAVVSRLFAWRGRDPRAVERLIASTGSTLEAEGVALYARLVASPAHVAGALAMMANWDLAALERDLPRLAVPIRLLAGERDWTVPPGAAQRAARSLANATCEILPGLGHLAHEERADLVAARLLKR